MVRTDIVRCVLVAMLALAAVAVLTATVARPADGTITGDQPPAYGDWVIGNATVVTDETVLVEGNLTVNAPLDVQDSVIAIASHQPGARSVLVTSSGQLTATGSTFTRGDPGYGYGFEVRGQTELDGCVVDGTEDGVWVITSKRVDLLSTVISGFTHRGLYLVGADGTTVRGVSVVSNTYSGILDATMEINDAGQLVRWVFARDVPVVIEGGRPTIDGLDISVNGTLNVVGTLDINSPAYAYIQIKILDTLMLVESPGLTGMTDVHVRDSTINVQAYYYINIHFDPSPSRHYVYNHYYMCPILVHNPLTMALSDISVESTRVGTTTLGYFVANGLLINSAQLTQGTFGVLAMLDETYDDTSAHSISVTLTDSTFYRGSAVWVLLAATGTDKDGTRLDATLVVDNVQVRQTTAEGGVRFENSVGHAGVLYLDVEISITDSEFAENGNIAINLALSGGGPTLNTGTAGGAASGGPLTVLHDNTTIEDCVFRANSAYCIQILLSAGGSASSITDAAKAGGGGPMNIFERTVVRGNVFEDITTTASAINMAGSSAVHNGTETVIMDRNSFARISTGTVPMINIVEKEVFEFTNNTLVGSESRATAPSPNLGRNLLYITCVGGDAEKARPARTLISWNNFTGNRYSYTSSDMYKGEILLYRYGGDVEVSHNIISGDSSDAFLNLQEYAVYSGYTSLEFNDNQVLDSPDLKCVVLLYNYDVYHRLVTITVERNVMKRCGPSPLLDYYDQGSTLELNDFDATISIVGNTVEDATGQVVRAHGNLRVADNTFTRCKGYALYLPFLNEHLPVLSGNVFQACHDLIYMGGKATALGGLTAVLEGLDLDCTGNALRFNNMVVTLDDVKVSDNAELAVVAENSVVLVVGGEVEVGSGRIIGTGSIMRYHVLEAYVTWANATGGGTGVPATDVPVVLLDNAGRATLTRSTGDDGGLGIINVLAWSIRSNFVTVHTPHTILIGTPGIARSMRVEFDRDYVGADALRVQLVDDRLPVVRLTSPAEGQVFGADELSLEGFVVEMGSGILGLDVTVGGGTPVALIPDQNGRFALRFTDLPEGTVLLKVTATDVAGNVDSTGVTIVVDTTPPDVRIATPSPGVLTSAASIPVVVEVEPGTAVFINGVRQQLEDDTLSMAWSLSEGENTILIKAIDSAGNEATVAVSVTRDSVPPLLDVATPGDGQLVGIARISVSGATEPGADAWLIVLHGGEVVLNASLAPAPDGTFSLMVDLVEGASELVLRARDGAGNLREARLTVTVDVTPPNVEFTSPEDGILVRTGLVRVTATVDTDCQLYLNGAPVTNTGTVDALLSLGEGANTVELKAVDAAGNARVRTLVINVDTTPPVLGITHPLSDHVSTKQRSVVVAGTVLGDLATLTVMGVPVTTVGGAFSTTVQLPSEGRTEVPVVAVDAAGNEARRVIVVDAAWAKPALSVELRTDGATGVSTNGTALLEGTSSAGTIELVQDGASGQSVRTFILPAGGAFTVAVHLDVGHNTLVVRAIDATGTVNETSPYEVEYVPPPTKGGEEEEAVGPMDVAVVLLGVGLAMLATVVAVLLSRQRSE